MLTGGKFPPASLLAVFQGNMVHLYWEPSAASYDKVVGGASFVEVTKGMKDQGVHPVTADGKNLLFPNGFNTNYVVTIDGDTVVGTNANKNGTRKVEGKCVSFNG
jgi:hypothetical protein